MQNKSYVRLRQVCLATLDIRGIEGKISRILGQSPCHREQLEHFGLENSMFAVGGSFIELVAPTHENTAVHRFLKRNSGVGGYMAIFDCDNVADRKLAAEKLGIIPVFERNDEHADLLQLDPKETGVTLVEFDHHYGGEDRFGNYHWAGNDWKDNLNPNVDIIGVTMNCLNKTEKSEQWSELFGATPMDLSLSLDHGQINFTHSSTKDYFGSMHLACEAPDTILKAAENEGLSVESNNFELAGLKWTINSK